MASSYCGDMTRLVALVVTFIAFVCVQMTNSTTTGTSSEARQRLSNRKFPSRSRQTVQLPHPPIVRTGTQLPTDPWQLFNITVRHNGNKTEGLFPHVFNLATKANIVSNATCGSADGQGSEQFCKLVEHVKRRPQDQIQCGVCDENGQPNERHPIEYAIDGSNRWWQSPTIANGRRFNWVTITLDLKQIYQVAYVIIKAANSPRPGQWILERSVDGFNYSPWQYSAMTDSDCWHLFGVMPTTGVPRYKSDDEVICTSAFSQLDPLENGEIHISLVNGRPGVEGPSQQLINFTAARYIRLRMQRIRTLNADLMMDVQDDPKYIDPTVTNRYFYSIKDISVGGQCICYGHARYCPVDPVTLNMKCQCEGNTCGDSCEKCCPMYNQLKWNQGTYTQAFICEECNCFGHAESCVYNASVEERQLSLNIHGIYQGGGICNNCMHHTMGINCELCEDGFYRPSGVDHNRPDACQICLCDVVGSNGQCIKDDSDEHLGINAGDCVCREGYCGALCDQCAPGYTGYPDCEPCPCSPAGSVNDDLCEQCICKQHVCGEFCDTCLPGFYNLQAYNPVGCDACFCFAVSNQCHSSTWGREMIKVMSDWYVTDVAGSGIVSPVPEQVDDSLSFNTDMTSLLNHDVYWMAPRQYIGNKVTSYGGVFEYSFQYLVNCTAQDLDPESYLANHDFILEGSGMRIGLGGSYMEEETQHVVSVNFTEHGWVHLENSTSPSGSGVHREEFLVLLADIERLLIRASYSIYQSEMKLLYVSLDLATETGTGPRMEAVEMCNCPAGYAGTSCESCAPGYRRVDNMLVGGVCEPCQCNGHSESCDVETGECLNCQHNTEGTHCELCSSGFVGNALNGIDGCNPCACPLSVESNSFAESCVEMPGNAEPGYMCLNCHEGYVGQFCERCDAGYYGNPQEPGSTCQLCQCNGNSVDGDGRPWCDPWTGQCLACADNTDGFNCDRCHEGFFGTSFAGDCRACDCDWQGSLNVNGCDQLSGQCQCRPRFTGRDCSQCQPGYYDATAGCVPCQCDGAVAHSGDRSCHQVTGKCNCLPGVGGALCTECIHGYYQFSSAGCKPCSCHSGGSVDESCDQRTGQCRCKQNVDGRNCDQCPENHWGLNVGLGCQPCQCNSTGSSRSGCDPDTGSCSCKPGVSSRTCDQCATGFYGFSRSGCRKCDECTKPGHICDPITGKCVCPPYTMGPACEHCNPDSWGYDPIAGCKPCRCSDVGSSGTQCNPSSGQCSCIDSYQGQRCDQCPFGHFNFPSCSPCDCHEPGTRSEDCRNGLCQCDDIGQCPCKANVNGQQCTDCKRGSFGEVTLDNPAGCISCFCFDRTDRCRQAPYIWSEVTLPSQAVSFSVNGDTGAVLPSDLGVLVVPEGASAVHIHSKHVDEPIFWSLGSAIRGDRTLSYNGRLLLKSTLDAERGGLAPSGDIYKRALVVLVGNSKMKLFYIPPPPAKRTTNQRSRPYQQEFNILLREDNWVNETGHHVTRKQLMIALQNVQHWLVKAAENSGRAREARLFDLSLSQAMPAKGNVASAHGVEICSCPPYYTGLSCQDPVDGRYRVRPLNLEDLSDIIDLVGTSEPCECHGRSDACDRETGQCQSCREHTAGKHCDICKPGYYSLSSDVLYLDCQPCYCPMSKPQNNFSPTCVTSERGDDYVCDACLPGYTGDKCHRCAPGYYGNPMIINGTGCQPCACNPEGSRDQMCDEVTGLCTCFPGIMGRACDQCQPLYAVIDGVCRSCREGCTGVLLSSLDEPLALTDNFNSSAAALLPWARLNKANSSASRLRNLLQTYNVADFFSLNEELSEAKQMSARLRHKSQELLAAANTEDEVALDTASEANELLRAIQERQSSIRDLIDNLMRPIAGAGGVDLTELLRQASQWMDAIKNTYTVTSSSLDAAEDELGLAEELLETVKHLAQNTTSANNVMGLSRAVDDVVAKIADLQSHVISVNDRLTTARLLNQTNQQHVKAVKQRLDRIKKTAASAKELCRNATSINEMASHYLWNVSSANYKSMQDLLRILRAKKSELDDWTRDLTSDLDGLPLLVKKAEDHAAKLQQQAESQEGLFSTTRASAEDPLSAAQAYEKTKQAIDEAELAAQEAIAAAAGAFTKMNMDNDGSLSRQAKDALERSSLLSRNASDMKTSIDEEFRDRLTSVTEKLDETSDTIDGMATDLANIRDDLPEPTRNIRDDTEKIKSLAEESKSLAEDILGSVQYQKEDIEENFTPKIQELQELSDHGWNAISNAVKRASSEAHKLIDDTKTIENKTSNVRRLGAEIGNTILELRRMIEETRALAASIKVSLSHTGKCVRKYAVPTKTSLANSITLHFKTNSTSRDMLLFLLANPNTSDFMSLELIDRKVRFAWDVGGGSSLVEHLLEVESEQDQAAEHDKWYRVIAQRIGNVGKLMVQKVSDRVPGQFSTAVSYPSHSRLDLNPNMDLFIAGLPSGYTGPSELATSSFSGCVGDVEMDGSPIGLFNFQALVEGEGCNGCTPVPTSYITPASNIYQFDGSGFAIKPQVRYVNHSYEIQFQFKGITKDGLLFFTGNDTTGDFMSVEMINGHIVFRFGFGDSEETNLTTNQTYNTNKWIKLKARRNRANGLLEVNGERVEGSSTSSVQTMDLAHSQIYFAGVPKSFNSARYNIIPRNFIGCMQSLTAMSRGVYTISLADSLYAGMTFGCQPNARVVGLPGTGLLELGSSNLEKEAGIGLSFRTQNSNGLILLAKSRTGFYSMSLLNGQMNVWLSGGGEPLVITTAERYSDGLVHSAYLHKDNRQIKLYIDETLVGSGRMPAGATTVDNMKGEAGGMFVGGVPEEGDYENLAATLVNFKGCITDLMINGRLIAFDAPTNFRDADVGRCIEADLFDFMNDQDAENLALSTPSVPSFTVVVTPSPRSVTSSSTKRRPPTTTPLPSSCAEEGDFDYAQNAVSFGDNRHSNAEIDVQDEHINENFNVTMLLRTYYAKGLLFYITNLEQTAYIAIQVINGTAYVIYKGDTVDINTLHSDVTLDDGDWHYLAVTRDANGIQLWIDDREPVVDTKIHNISVVAPIYVGGLPKFFKPASVQVLTESFKGCVKNFDLNGNAIDVANSKYIMGVRPCFLRAERGVHFDGSGFATYAEQYRIVPNFTVKFDFRTTQPDVVIMSTSGMSGALAIDLHEGKLKFQVVKSDATVYVAESKTCEFCLCNNQWHSVTAEMTSNKLILTVDGKTTTTSITPIQTNYDFYLGGFPVNANVQLAAHTSNFFVGCLRNLLIQQTPVDWHEIHGLFDVHISDCPISVGST